MKLPPLTVFLALVLSASLAQAQPVEIRDAWVRVAVPGQSGTGAFMKIMARENLRLVGASTPLAGVTEIHEMKMTGNVMQMRAVAALELPAGKTVELKPGGMHLMLMDLKGPLVRDSALPLTLLFSDAQGRQTRMELRLPVSLQPAAPGASVGHKH